MCNLVKSDLKDYVKEEQLQYYATNEQLANKADKADTPIVSESGFTAIDVKKAKSNSGKTTRLAVIDNEIRPFLQIYGTDGTVEKTAYCAIQEDVPILMGTNYTTLDIPKENSTTGKITRFAITNENLNPVVEVWNNGTREHRVSIINENNIKPIKNQISFLPNAQTSEPTNCTYTVVGNICIVNLAGVTVTTAGTIAQGLPKALARANEQFPYKDGITPIFYISENSSNLNCNQAFSATVYTQLIYPIAV